MDYSREACFAVFMEKAGELISHVASVASPAEKAISVSAHALNVAGTLGNVIAINNEINNHFTDQGVGNNFEEPGDGTNGEKLNIDKNGFIINSRINQLHHISKTERRNPRKFIAIILHRTVSSNANSTFQEFRNTKKGVHFIIDQKGVIYQIASLNKYTIHIWEGKQRAGYRSIHNNNTIGIEHVGLYHSNTQTWDPISPAMEKSSAWLINSLMKTYNLTSFDIYPHEYVQRKTPGEGGTVQNAISLYLEDNINSTTWHPPIVVPKTMGAENNILKFFLK